MGNNLGYICMSVCTSLIFLNGELNGYGERDPPWCRSLGADAGPPSCSSYPTCFPPRLRPASRSAALPLAPRGSWNPFQPLPLQQRGECPVTWNERPPFGQLFLRTSRAPGKVGRLRDRTQQGGGGAGRAICPPPLVPAVRHRLLSFSTPSNCCLSTTGRPS